MGGRCLRATSAGHVALLEEYDSICYEYIVRSVIRMAVGAVSVLLAKAFIKVKTGHYNMLVHNTNRSQNFIIRQKVIFAEIPFIIARKFYRGQSLSIRSLIQKIFLEKIR